MVQSLSQIIPKSDRNEDFPDFKHPFYQKIEPNLIKFHDLWVGKDAWFLDGECVDDEKCHRYLPKEKYEEQYQYIDRLERSRYENRFREVIEKEFAGLLTQFEVKDASEQIERLEQNVDLKGNSLPVFLKAADCLALRDGLCFVYVEYQKADPAIEREDLRQASGRRPFLILYPRHQIINWQVRYDRGFEEINLVVIKEYAYVQSGTYKQEIEERYRILTPGYYKVVKIIEQNGEKIVVPCFDKDGNILEGSTSLKEIPLVPYSLTSTDSFETSHFPLKDIAELCLEYYRLHSDKLENLHKCNIPIPTFHETDTSGGYKGENYNERETPIGYHTAYWNVDIKWSEPAGNAIAATQLECDKIHQAIDAKTLSFLTGSEVERTATEARINAGQIKSNFMGLSLQKESAVERIFKYFNDYESDINQIEYPSRIEIDKQLIDVVSKLSPKDLIDAQVTGTFSKEFVLRRLSEEKAFGRYLNEEEVLEEVGRSNVLEEEVLG